VRSCNEEYFTAKRAKKCKGLHQEKLQLFSPATLNPKYALAILLRPVIASKSVTTLLFSTLPTGRQVHHSGAMPQSPNSLISLHLLSS
jgi:hypothetical protein